jgi:polyisoprenoid-binding protein YceI
MKMFISLMLVLSTNLFALEKKVSTNNFKEAAAHKEYVKFTGESTKFGVVTTSFEGFVKNLNLKYDQEKTALKKLVVEFNVKDLDTDNDSRNEKMWDLCFEQQKYPKIIAFLENLSLKEGETQVSIELKIKDVTQKIPFKITIRKIEKTYEIKGSGIVKYTDYKIANPSILVAKVKEEFQLDFQFIINE